MNEELINTLTELAKKFGVAIDWTSQNALPYVQELASRIVKFEVATSILWAIVGAVFIISFRWWMPFIKYLAGKEKEDPYDMYDFYKCLATAGMIITMIIGGLIISQQAYDLIQCAILPETVVLRYLGLFGTI